MRSPTMAQALTLLLAALLGLHQAACRSARPPTSRIPPPGPQASVETEARCDVAMRFLLDPNAPLPRLAPDEEYVPPEARHLPMPHYPERALRGASPPAAVTLRVRLDADGVVTHMGDSPLATGSPGAYAADFRDAAEAAVRAWVFSPARIDTVKPGVDLDGDGTPDYSALVTTRRIDVFFDVRFDFRVEAGHGRVVVSPPSDPEPALT